MPLDVSASTTIDRPPDAVARVAFDPTNDPNWIGGVATIEPVTSGPTSLGSRVIRRGSFMGRPLEWLMEVVALDPDRRIELHALKSPFPMDVTYTLEPTAGARATRTTVRVRGEARGSYAIAGPLMGWMVRRSLQADVARLQRLVESSVT